MEIKFRMKNQVDIRGNFDEEKTRKSISFNLDHDGLDLTGYKVVYVQAGRGGYEKAHKTHQEIPDAIIIFQYDWHNGWGSGIILPENFDPSRVKSYMSGAKVLAAQAEQRELKLDQLAGKIIAEIPNVEVRTNDYGDALSIGPKQPVFSKWNVSATTFEEAKAGIALKRPIWDEWNERALKIYHQQNLPVPTNGNVDIVFRTKLHNEYAYISFYKKVQDSLFNQPWWFVLEKQPDGEWKLTGEVRHIPK